MELRTGDLVLRTATTAAIDEVVEAVRASLPELKRWMPWAHDGYGPKDVADWLARVDIDPSNLQFLLYEEDKLTGVAGVWRNTTGMSEIGYWVRSDATGRGIATAATKAIARLAMTELGYDEVAIKAEPANLASQRVAEKAGAHRLPEIDRHEHDDGSIHELVEFRITPE